MQRILVLALGACIPLACQPDYLPSDALGPLLIATTTNSASHTTPAPLPIFDAIEGRVGHHAVSVVSLQTGDLLAAWYSYIGPGELDGATIFTARLPLGQSAWTAPRMIQGLPDRSANPVLFIDGSTVHLLFTHVSHLWWSASLMQCDSTDDGANWSPPRAVNAGLGSNVRNPPIRLTDETWLLPAYSDFWLNGFLLQSSDGVHWTRGASFIGDGDDALLQPAIARVNDNDALLMVARNRGGHRIYAAASADAGANWTRPGATDFPNPDSAVALKRLADRSLLMVYNDSSNHRAPLVAVRSTDGGATWGERCVIAEGDGDYAYPWIVQTIDDRTLVFFSENRDRIVWVELESR